MSRLTDRLERDLREVAAGAHPSPSAWESIAARLDDRESEVAVALAPAPARSKRPAWIAAAAAVLFVIAGSVAVVATRAGDDESISIANLDLTTTFVSPRNGFSIRHPDGAVVTPAEQAWGVGELVDEWFDVVEIGSAAGFRAASVPFPGEGPCLNTAAEPMPCGTTDEQIDRHLSSDLPGGCGVPRSQQATITIDGQAGRIAECPNQIEATVVAGGRLYLFALSHDGSDAKATFDAFVATIDLTPETAVGYPGMTATFVSPTYGYSFGYFDRGGAEPATELWDPASGPLDDPFDSVETGLGYYFQAASTAIPDGVSIDEWVDEYITPVAAGGCGVPHSQQAEIIIDGQSGRVAECSNQIEATVVAGGRLYRFILSHSGGDERAYFDAWMATVDLTPETAAALR